MSTDAFGTEREAKEYLIARILAEAEREAVVLSEVDRKMLYFSESGWTLPEMAEVSAIFDQDYDQDEYEQTMGALVGKILARNEAEGGDEQAAWDRAVIKLSEGDHYLLVLIGMVEGDRRKAAQKWWARWLPSLPGLGQRRPGDRARLWVMGILLGFGLVIAVWLVAVFRS